jgi:hypothetical protein
MTPTRIVLYLALIAAAFSPLDATAQAAYRGHRSSRDHHSNGRGYRSVRSGYSAASRAYADMLRANAVRVAAIRAAQAQVSSAHFAMKRTRTKIERDFKYSPELTAAEAELAEANRRLQEARTAVRDRLGADPDYQAAKLAKDGPTLLKMHTAGYNADSAVQAALRNVSQAGIRITALKKQFEGSVTRDPQWTAASQTLQNARVKLAQANAAGNRALGTASRARTGRYPHR